MFDPRNKGQPKLVYSRVPQNDAQKTDQQPLPTASNFQTPLSKSNSLQASSLQANSSLGSSTKDERQRQMVMFNDMQKDTQQIKSNQHSAQFHRQQQQLEEMRQQTQQHQLNVTVVEVVSAKKQQQLQQQHQQPTKGIELNKIPMQDTEGKNAQAGNSKLESYGDMKDYRNKHYEYGSEKRLVNDKLQTSSSSSSSSGMSADNEKKFSASTSGIRTASLRVGSTNDSNNAILLRHPRIHSDSSTTPSRSQMSPQSPNQYLSPQQFMYYKQHQSPKQQQQQQQDTSHPQDRRPRPEVVRVRSYSAGRQPMPTNSHSASFKSANPGQTWSIPRVSTATRPHSLNVPSTRHDDSGSRTLSATRPHSLNVPVSRHDDSGPRSPAAQQDFSTYNPSASPRALRSQGKPHNEVIMRQRSSSPTSSINSSSSQPKSILKPLANKEQPDVFFSSRPPLLLPRAHSEKGNPNAPRDFDFSSILTTNKDIFPTRVPTIQVTSQTSEQTISNNSRQPLQRPLSANAGLGNFDLKPEGRPIRKSVTFNSLVQLLHEDRVSTVRCVDA